MKTTKKIMITKKYQPFSFFRVFHSNNVKSNYDYQKSNSPIPCYWSEKQTVKKNHPNNTMG